MLDRIIRMMLLSIATTLTMFGLIGCVLFDAERAEKWHYRQTWGLPDNQLSFDQAQWKKYDNSGNQKTDHRWRMFQDLTKPGKILGANESQVLSLLGKPSKIYDTEQYWKRWQLANNWPAAHIYKPFVRIEWTLERDPSYFLPFEKSTLQNLDKETQIWEYYLWFACGASSGSAKGNYSSSLQLLLRHGKCECMRLVFARYWSSHG